MKFLSLGFGVGSALVLWGMGVYIDQWEWWLGLTWMTFLVFGRKFYHDS